MLQGVLGVVILKGQRVQQQTYAAMVLNLGVASVKMDLCEKWAIKVSEHISTSTQSMNSGEYESM
jgi:hypothetical protein